MPLRVFLRDPLPEDGVAPLYSVGIGAVVTYATSLIGVSQQTMRGDNAMLPRIPIPTSGLDGPEVQRLALMVLGSVVLPKPCTSREEALKDAQENLTVARRDLELTHFLDQSDGLPEGHYLAVADPLHVGRLAFNKKCFALCIYNPRGVIFYAPQAEQTPLMEFHDTLAEAQLAAGTVSRQTGQG
jgi:hypothetical protein